MSLPAILFAYEPEIFGECGAWFQENDADRGGVLFARIDETAVEAWANFDAAGALCSGLWPTKETAAIDAARILETPNGRPRGPLVQSPVRIVRLSPEGT